jgi:hypothetical protein
MIHALTSITPNRIEEQQRCVGRRVAHAMQYEREHPETAPKK